MRIAPASALLSLLAVLCLSALPCRAETPFAVVDTREVIRRCEPGRQVLEQMEKKYAPVREKLEAMRRELETVEKTVPPSPAARLLKDTEVNKRTAALNAEEARSRKEFAAEEATLLKPVAQKVLDAVKSYGREHHITAIQEKGPFLYLDPAADLTEEIIKAVNEAK